MKGVLVDSNIILDVFLNDSKWGEWSESKLEEYSAQAILYINSIQLITTIQMELYLLVNI